MNIEYRTQLHTLIQDSQLPDKQKIMWGLFSEEASDDEVEAIFGAVSESDSNLLLLTEYLHEKIKEIKERHGI